LFQEMSFGGDISLPI